ncbi:GntR family transcriptional regulator [Acidisoma cellulosilytica]|uniref:GntR family transcriptional regulator n=1 Tax=Acidisoma cellulosilyticum TaxID=2802395 RepID=A0A964E555_9PROT|nr:GntR family transcriptional regulator [Acidisoma cellulosilyticum]MCB8882149.1 GntR family transcriptional regulator [Acidisoma cellulosilyticum]
MLGAPPEDPPIARHSLADQAMLRLRQDIVQGRLAPDEVLTEQSLSARLGVGRGTVRTALFSLEADELVVRAPYSNWRVAPLNEQVIWEIYTLREALEGLAARVLADRLTENGLIRLQRALAGLVAVEDASADARVAADLHLHRDIVELTRHSHLIRRYAALSAKIEWLYRWSERHWPKRRPMADSHIHLIQALTGGDGDAAEAAVRLHISISLREDLDGFRELQAQSVDPV